MMLIGLDAIESPDYFNLSDWLEDGRRERRRRNSTVTMRRYLQTLSDDERAIFEYFIRLDYQGCEMG